MVQDNYDVIIPILMAAPPIDRTVPVFENKPKNEPVKIIINEKLETAQRQNCPFSKG